MTKWVKVRNGCSDDACVKRAYQTRLSKLKSSDGEKTIPAFSGQWHLELCDKSISEECGGFTVYLIQTGEKICGDHFFATPGRGRLNEGAPRSIIGSVTEGNVANIEITSGRNGAVFSVRATRDGDSLNWEVMKEVKRGLEGDSALVLDKGILRQEKPDSSYRVALSACQGLSVANAASSKTAALDAANEKPLDIPDKPGFFRLDQSTNNAVCYPLSQIINDDIKKFGETRFGSHSEFAAWKDVDEENIERGKPQRYDESVERADVDINNDGIVDQVVRTKWTLRGVLEDALTFLPLNQKKVVIGELLKTKKNVMFNAGNYWLDRYRKKYGLANEYWSFDGVASLNLFQQNGGVYVVAQNYAAPHNVSANIYVFSLDRNYEPDDVCMFVKICPCGGCERMSASQNAKTLPAKKWCHK